MLGLALCVGGAIPALVLQAATLRSSWQQAAAWVLGALLQYTAGGALIGGVYFQPDCTPHPPGTSAIGVVMPPANRIVVAPPAYDDMDEDDEEEDDERPLTRGEIVRKTLRGLESKEKRLAETREKQLTKL